jgi:DNA-binding MarR family transcriptional regulator
VDRLVVKGLLERNPDPSDRRRMSLVLTGKGRKTLTSAPHPAQGHLLAGLESLVPGQILNLNLALKILEAVLHADGFAALQNQAIMRCNA